MTDPDLNALADEPAPTGLESELLDALEVTNAILEMIQKDLRAEARYRVLVRELASDVPVYTPEQAAAE